MRVKKDINFLSCFDERSGKYFRTGIIDNGMDTGKDPFMASFPELLDIGIMGHCEHGRSGLCLKSGIECYQDGLHSNKDNMPVFNFQSIAEQCKGKTFQFALGGCGDPDQHEHFREILEICAENNIVPNFTTSGFGMTKRIAEICRKYCGAVAVSWYRSDYTNNAIKLLLDVGVKTNIHYVLSKDTIYEAYEGLKEGIFPLGINAIVFLLHKPVGLGTKDKIIEFENTEFWDLINYICTSELEYKIGFDSCTVPALINNLGNIDIDSLDTCEGGRWSAYITPDMKMLPCSLDNQEQRWAVDLRKYSIEEAWNSQQFEDFRNYFRNACENCNSREYCLGGCPICEEIVLCKKRMKNSMK